MQIITNNKELLEVQAIRTKLKDQLKAIEAQKETVSRPLLDAIAARRAEFAPTIAKYIKEIERIDLALKTYQRSISDLQSRILSDNRLTTSTAIAKLAEVHQPTRGFRKQQVLKITDLSSIPKKYFDLNKMMLMSDLKAGKEVKGAQIDVEMIPIS